MINKMNIFVVPRDLWIIFVFWIIYQILGHPISNATVGFYAMISIFTM